MIEAACVLERGGIAAFPTDTVFGLGALLDSPEAISRIYAIKSREKLKALPLLVGSISQAETLAESVSPCARILMQVFWPGALTLVMQRSSKVPDYITGGRPTVALRMPAHEVPLGILNITGRAMCGTSANISGWTSALTAEQVRLQLGDSIDYLIDAGEPPCGTESTIVDVSGPGVRILRPGGISGEELSRYVELHKEES